MKSGLLWIAAVTSDGGYYYIEEARVDGGVDALLVNHLSLHLE